MSLILKYNSAYKKELASEENLAMKVRSITDKESNRNKEVRP